MVIQEILFASPCDSKTPSAQRRCRVSARPNPRQSDSQSPTTQVDLSLVTQLRFMPSAYFSASSEKMLLYITTDTDYLLFCHQIPSPSPRLNMTPIHVHIFSCGSLTILCCPMFIYSSPTGIHPNNHCETPRNCRKRRRCCWIGWQGIYAFLLVDIVFGDCTLTRRGPLRHDFRLTPGVGLKAFIIVQGVFRAWK